MNTLVFSLVLVMVFSCDPLTEPIITGSESGTVMVIDFDTPADTAGFKGYGYWKLTRDSSDQIVRTCLNVSGGCVVPHLQKELTSPYGGRYGLRITGKALIRSGYVSLTCDDKTIGVAINQKSWQEYQTTDILQVQPGRRCILEMMCGGIVADAMLIDKVEIFRW